MMFKQDFIDISEIASWYFLPFSEQTIQRGTGFFSDDEANPLRDYWHVIIPYCSSDTWAGTGYSQGSGYRNFKVITQFDFNFLIFSKTDNVTYHKACQNKHKSQWASYSVKLFPCPMVSNSDSCHWGEINQKRHLWKLVGEAHKFKINNTVK